MANSIKKIATGKHRYWALALLVSNPAGAAIALQQWTLPSGAQVLLAESPAIPMVDVQLDFDAGGRRDPAGKAGLASATAGMGSKGLLAKAGQSALDENQLAQAWADLGASFSASAGTDRTSYQLRSLTEPDLLGTASLLAARQLAEPALADALWRRERERLVASLKEAETRPATQASRAYSAAVFGNHPYARQATPASLAAIQAADLQAFHRQGMLACRAKVSIVGALNRAQAEVLVNTLLSRLPQGACPVLPLVAEVAPLAQPLELRLPFDSAQAHVLLGQPGIKRNDPDFFPLFVGNYLLGGGTFVSRLTTEVREKRGLTYSVSSGFNPGLHAGSFTISLQTRPDQAAQALQVSREVLTQFVTDGPSQADLQTAKTNLVNSFALRIDSNRKLLDNIANIAWHGLPLDYLDQWTAQVDKVTVADVKAAFARTLQPARMVTVLLGAKP
ncbi:MAG: M16 family metallopeptidase [Burkholderiales bacterium]